MRHGNKIKKLNRTHAHRKAMLGNMAASLIKSDNKRIITTLTKAKALRVYIEPLITKAKSDTTHSRRTVFSYLQDKDAVRELFGDVSVRVADRPGGYTRVLKLGPRKGDNAEMALIELVDFNEFMEEKPSSSRKGRRRKKKSGGDQEGAKTAAADANATEAPVEEAAETPEAKAEPEAPAEEPAAEEAPAADAAPAEDTPAEEPVADAGAEGASEEAPAEDGDAGKKDGEA